MLLLHQIANGKSVRSSEAVGLLKNIDFKFIYLLLFFDDLLFQIHSITKYLQDIKANMAKAIVLINSLKEHFSCIRNDISFHNKLFNEANNIAKN